LWPTGALPEFEAAHNSISRPGAEPDRNERGTRQGRRSKPSALALDKAIKIAKSQGIVLVPKLRLRQQISCTTEWGLARAQHFESKGYYRVQPLQRLNSG